MMGTTQATCPNCGHDIPMTAHDRLHGGGVTCHNCHTLLSDARMGANDDQDRSAGIYSQRVEMRRVDG